MEATGIKLRCVACGHENQATDNACAACGSTLNLRACPACEAINGRSAQSCHACGAAFPDSPATVVEETVRAAPGEMPGRTGRMPMLFEQPAAARPAYRMAKMAVVVIPLVALGYGAGYLYRGNSAAPMAPEKQAEAASPKVVQRDSSTATAQSDAAAPKAVVSGTAEGKITGVTHLRRGDAPVAAAAAAPVPVRVEPKPAKPAAPVAPERTATIPGPAPAQSHFVTHTRAPRTAVPPTPTPPTAAASTAAAVVAPASACAESVAALGLCKADSKGEGK